MELVMLSQGEEHSKEKAFQEVGIGMYKDSENWQSVIQHKYPLFFDVYFHETYLKRAFV